MTKLPYFDQISATQTATGLPACYAIDKIGRVWFNAGGYEGKWRLLDRTTDDERGG